MTVTYDSIATTTLGSAASTITFSSIPATYTDLRVVLVARSSTATQFFLRYNNDSSSLYSITRLSGDGSSASSSRFSFDAIFPVVSSFSTTIPYLYEIDVFSYAGSTNKTCLITSNEDRNGAGTVVRSVGLYRSTTAISTVNIVGDGNFAIGTTATLYGIKSE